MGLSVGTAEGSKGTRVRGALEVVKGLNSVQIPVAVITGAADGPVVGLTAGTHPCEYAGVEAIGRLYRELDPRVLSGVVILVPVVNMPGFKAITARVNPLDGLNIQRVFPGVAADAPPDIHAKWIGLAAGDSVSHRIARRIFQDVALRCDYLMDLHGGDLGEELFPYVIFRETRDARLTETCKGMALAFGTEHVRIGNPTNDLIGEAMLQGIPGIMTEVGFDGRYNEDHIGILVRGARNVLRHVGVLDGSPEPIEDFDTHIIKRQEDAVTVTSTTSGIYRPYVKPRQTFQEGDLLAEVTDEWGETVETFSAQHTGLVRIVYRKRIVNPGDALFKYDRDS